MSDPSDTFVALYLRNEAELEQIDDFVDRWHEGSEDISLQDFLGMYDDEYAAWLKRPEALPALLVARQTGLRRMPQTV